MVGLDDHELAYTFDLTTVAQPVAEQGAAAARWLLEQLDAGSGAGRPGRGGTDLDPRGSAGAARVDRAAARPVTGPAARRRSAQASSSARVGGSAPARWQVIPRSAPRGSASRSSSRTLISRRLARARSHAEQIRSGEVVEQAGHERVARADRVDHRDRRGGDVDPSARGDRPRAPAPPRVSMTTDGPRSSHCSADLGGLLAGGEPGEVLVADLDQVARGHELLHPGLAPAEASPIRCGRALGS